MIRWSFSDCVHRIEKTALPLGDIIWLNWSSNHNNYKNHLHRRHIEGMFASVCSDRRKDDIYILSNLNYLWTFYWTLIQRDLNKNLLVYTGSWDGKNQNRKKEHNSITYWLSEPEEMCKGDCTPMGNTGKEKHRNVSWYQRYHIHCHPDLSLCVHHMSQDHLNIPNTIFCIVFPSVKYKLNIDQSMQSSLVKPRRKDWDVCLILTKKSCDI